MKTLRRSRLRSTSLTVVILIVGFAASASSDAISFESEGWQMFGDETQVELVDGHTALRMTTGRAIQRQIDFSDGTIEFDLQMTGYRSFVYIQFRLESDGEYEEFYFRPHKSLLPDAIQYTPVFRRAAQWQLYHDQHSTAAARFTPDEWLHMRVIVEGTKAAVFVGDVSKPQLIVPRLARGRSSGGIAVRAGQPRQGSTGRPPGLYTASFANLTVSPSTDGFDFSQVEEPPRAAGMIQEWQLSDAFDPGEGPVRELPQQIVAGSWRTADAEPSGLTLLAREVPKPEGVRRATVLARLHLPASEPRIERLDFGYSDEVSIFLNGRLLFSGDDSYSFTNPRRQGLITIDQGSVYLPLEAGNNELILAVTDVFGGWGLMGRLGAQATAAE